MHVAYKHKHLLFMFSLKTFAAVCRKCIVLSSIGHAEEGKFTIYLTTDFNTLKKESMPSTHTNTAANAEWRSQLTDCF